VPRVKGEDGSAASPVGALLDPRGSLSAAIPAKAIAESISKCRRQLKAWLELGSAVSWPALPSVIGKHASV